MVATLLDRLVRVVAKDGSVWWTLQEHVHSHEAINAAVIPDRGDDGDYDHLYYGGRKKKEVRDDHTRA